jgi:myo-inositol 2-dehydrogenase/D-chiro-inositol 1-dehydrogenase
MRIGLVGAGRMGEFHAEVLASIDDVETVVVSDVDHTRAELLVHRIGGEVVDSLDDLFNSSIDALVIAAPTPLHAGLILRGIDAGLPVFCEKPIALDIDATNRVVERVHESGALVQIGFNRRFDAGFRAVHDAVASGELGRVYVARMGTHDPAPPPLDYLRDSGGLFRDMHIHDFDAVRFVLGCDVEEVYASGTVLVDHAIESIGDVDTTGIVLRMTNGALVTMTGCRSNPPGYDVRVEVFGERDSIAAGIGPRTPMRSVDEGGVLAGGAGWEFFIDRFDPAYRKQMRAFVDLVRDRGQSACTVDDGREALLIAMAAELSLAERRAVAMAEVKQAVAVG